MPQQEFFVVDGVAPAWPGATGSDNVRTLVWSLALDQRVFGPRTLMVAFADADGSLRSIAFTDRVSNLLGALSACLAHLGRGAAAAVAYCDEPVSSSPSETLYHRFEDAPEVAAAYDV